MIPFIDIAMAALIKSLAFEWTVVWAPPEGSREHLAGLKQKDGQNSVGLPGISVWRTNSRLSEHFQQGLAQYGWPAGRTQADLDGNFTVGDFVTTKTIPVLAEYTIVAHARSLSDLNEFERELWFLESYGAVEFTIKCRNNDDQPVEIPLSMPLVPDEGIQYMRSTENSAKRVDWFSLEKRLIVDAFWCKSNVDPQIEEIDVTYNLITSGNPIEDEFVKKVIILPKTEE